MDGTGNTYSMHFGVFDTDRAGVVGYGHSIITVREGDTVSIANSYSNVYDPVSFMNKVKQLNKLDININTRTIYF